jgi:uncharacterized membrane protein
MLIAQTFNIQSHYPGGVLIWSLGSFATALVLRSKPILIFTSLLAGLWMYMSFEGRIPATTQYWLFPILILVLMITANRFRSAASFHILTLSSILFVPYFLFAYFDPGYSSEEFLFPVTGGIFGVLALAANGLARTKFGHQIMFGWMTVATLGTGFFQQLIIEDFDSTAVSSSPSWTAIKLFLLALVLALMGWETLRGRIKVFAAAGIALGMGLLLFVFELTGFTGVLPMQMLCGAAFFGICVLLLMRGMADHRTGLLWLGGVGFTAQALYVYFETFKDLLNTSLFFLIGGLLLLGLSVLALRLNKNLKSAEEVT